METHDRSSSGETRFTEVAPYVAKGKYTWASRTRACVGQHERLASQINQGEFSIPARKLYKGGS